MTIYDYCFVISLIFIGIIIYFIKKRLLDIKYSILWLVVSVMMLLLSINKNWVEELAAAFDIKYPPAFLFLVGILFCFLLMFNMTLIISDMRRQVTRLTQEIGILKSERKVEK